jgi:drug/metabolite transporter (DMT)-like permease
MDDIGIIIAYYEHLFVSLILIPIALLTVPMESYMMQKRDLALLVVLGAIVTAIGFSTYYNALNYYNPTTLSIASSLEAVYGIAFAFIIMKTVPELREIIGGIIIVLSVAFNEMCKKIKE